jgi:galactokinase
VEYRRVRHVVTENDRVLQMAAALESGDLETAGACMAVSHRSLADDYEVSTPELDTMVAIARRQTGVYGARMTGGGFGGSIVVLAKRSRAEDIRAAMAREYQDATGVTPEVLICTAAAGVEQVS